MIPFKFCWTLTDVEPCDLGLMMQLEYPDITNCPTYLNDLRNNFKTKILAVIEALNEDWGESAVNNPSQGFCGGPAAECSGAFNVSIECLSSQGAKLTVAFASIRYLTSSAKSQ